MVVSAAATPTVKSPPSIAVGEFEERRRKLAAAAGAEGLAGVIVWSLGGTSGDWYGDVMYLTNHHALNPHIPETKEWTDQGYSAVIVASDGTSRLLTTCLDDPDDRSSADEVRSTRYLARDVAKAAAELFAGERVGVVGLQTLLHGAFLRLEEELAGRCVLVPADHLVADLRRIKSPAEQEMLRHAAAVGRVWMESTLESFEPGRTEAEAVADGMRAFIAAGGWPYDLAVAAGERSAHYWGSSGLPHFNSTEPLADGDLVHCDVWGPVQGYLTDFARTTVVGGKPSDDQVQIIEGSVGVIEAIVSEMRPGTVVGRLYDIGTSWLAEHGFGSVGDDPAVAGHKFGEMFPAFGHGIGLGIENPHIVSGDETVLEPGMAISAEVVVGRPGVGSAIFEHNVIVTAEGPEVLTKDCRARWW